MNTYEKPDEGLGLVGPVITEGVHPFELLELIDLLLEPPLAGEDGFEVALSIDILTFNMSVGILTMTGYSRRINADHLTHSDSENEPNDTGQWH